MKKLHLPPSCFTEINSTRPDHLDWLKESMRGWLIGLIPLLTESTAEVHDPTEVSSSSARIALPVQEQNTGALSSCRVLPVTRGGTW